MGAQRQKPRQLLLAFPAVDRGAAPKAEGRRAEAPVAGPASAGPASEGPTMEEVCRVENLRKAFKRVRRNQGAPGIDGMTVGELGDYLAENVHRVRTVVA